jgi:hypothetical protein
MVATPHRETSVREYKRPRDYKRDAADRRREGWRVVSVLARTPRLGKLRRLLPSPAAAVFLRGPELLVTYSRLARPPASDPVRPLGWLRAPRLPARESPQRGWWLGWLILVLLVALLLLGVAGFLAEDAVPLGAPPPDRATLPARTPQLTP